MIRKVGSMYESSQAEVDRNREFVVVWNLSGFRSFVNQIFSS